MRATCHRCVSFSYTFCRRAVKAWASCTQGDVQARIGWRAHLEARGGGVGRAAEALQVEADAALRADGRRVLLQAARQALLHLPQHLHAVPCHTAPSFTPVALSFTLVCISNCMAESSAVARCTQHRRLGADGHRHAEKGSADI